MKRALIVIALMTGVALAWAAPPDRLPTLLAPPAEARTVVVVGGGVPAAGWEEATPNVWGARLDDNAANKTVDAWVGSDGQVFDVNSSVLHSTDVYQGTGSYALTSSNIVIGPSIADDNFDDGAFTVQWAFKATTAFTTGYIRFVVFLDTSDYSEDFIIQVNNSDTSLIIFWGETYNTVTVNDMTTGSWQVFRVVVDTGATHKITVYQGADEENLASVATDDEVAAVDMPATFYPSFGGAVSDAAKNISAVSGIIDDLKLWDTAVHP